MISAQCEGKTTREGAQQEIEARRNPRSERRAVCGRSSPRRASGPAARRRRTTEGAHGRYDVGRCLRWYVRYLQRKLRDTALPGSGRRTHGVDRDESTDSLSIESELKQIELAKVRVQLITVDRVNRDFASIALEIKQRFLQIPPRLAAELVGERDLRPGPPPNNKSPHPPGRRSSPRIAAQRRLHFADGARSAGPSGDLHCATRPRCILGFLPER